MENWKFWQKSLFWLAVGTVAFFGIRWLFLYVRAMSNINKNKELQSSIVTEAAEQTKDVNEIKRSLAVKEANAKLI